MLISIVLLTGILWETAAFASTEKKHKIQKEIKKIERRERGILEELGKLDREISRLKNEINEIEKTKTEIKKKLGRLEEETKRLKITLAARRGYLLKRLVALYKFSRNGYMAAILHADSVNAAVRTQKYIEVIIENDLKCLRNFEKEFKIFAEKRASFRKYSEKLAIIQSAKKKKLKDLRRVSTEKRKLLKTLKTRKEKYIEAIREIEKAQRELKRMISSLGKESSIATKETQRRFSLRRSTASFLPPLKHGRIIGHFGKVRHPTFNVVTFRKGIEIYAPEGSEIRAIKTGKVVFAGWFKGYGKLLIIDHGGGLHSLYAHASKLLKKQGDQVAEGETIALVGDTESLKGPCLYFEIRKNGLPRDPVRWIKLSKRW